MLMLLACWFLFVFPAILLYAVVLGARLYAQAGHQQVPGSIPRFGFDRLRGKQTARNGDNLLPEV